MGYKLAHGLVYGTDVIGYSYSDKLGFHPIPYKEEALTESLFSAIAIHCLMRDFGNWSTNIIFTGHNPIIGSQVYGATTTYPTMTYSSTTYPITMTWSST